jgi:hypothetical protein
LNKKEREKVIKIFVYILFLPVILSAEIRAVWVPAWDMADAETLDEIVKSCSENRINQTHYIFPINQTAHLSIKSREAML